MTDKTLYTEDSIESLSPEQIVNLTFPPPHPKVYKKRNGKRYVFYESGWVIGNYGVVFLEEIEPTKSGKRRALFKCPLCNKKFTARIDSVSGNKIKSCGCRKHYTSSLNAYSIGIKNTGPKQDITGQKFGTLTVLYPMNERDSSGNIYWMCKCDCGGKRKATAYNLKTGHIKYCPECAHYRNGLAHIGEKYGKLTIVDILKDKRASNNGLLCIARCDCGQIIQCPLNYILRVNGQQSCGKCTVSKGEEKIKSLLIKHNIIFTQQESFKGKMKMPNSVKCCLADFFLPKQNIVIEYNGEQHYFPIDFFGGEEGFKKTIKRDNWKKEYYNNHRLKCITIPYTDYDILNWEYLLKKGVSSEE